MKLSFDKQTNEFILDPLLSMLRLPDGWDRAGDTYRTKNLKAAAEFRCYSDVTAEKVFKRAFNETYNTPLRPLPSFLDPHQVEGVNHILTRKRSYIAHAPGAGKTATAIVASIRAAGPGKVLFIVPPTLAGQWESEIWKFSSLMNFWPHIARVPLSAEQDQMDWSGVFIILPDSLLTRDWVQEKISKMTFRLIAVDEASRFKDPMSERARVFYGGVAGDKKFHGMFQNARHVVLLDGSPMPNRPMELWAPTSALDPEAIDCMGMHEYGIRYCGATITDRGNWEYRHSSNEEELREKLRNRFMHVVTEDQLSHPERLRKIVYLSKDPRTREIKEWERSNLNKLTIDDLLAIGDHDDKGEIAHIRRELGIAKVPQIAQYAIERKAARDEKIIVFVWHREVAIEVSSRLSKKFRCRLVMGGTPAHDREESFKLFQEGKLDFIVGNIAAMGRGHNLQRADRVIFGEFSWTDELNKQCEKRASRRGRDKDLPVRSDYLAVAGSMDERVLNALFTKEKRVKRIIG